MRRPSPWIAVVTVIGLVAALVGCSSDASSPPSTLPTTTTQVTRPDDNVLRIGVLIPQGSANADIGEAISSGVRLAVSKINAGGGFGGQNVELVPADEGVSGAGVDPAITTLLDAGVDAIVGPASSINALSGLDEIVKAGVLSCSPTASASLLDDFPDQNLFFRTIPSDSLQALAIAQAVDRTGVSQAAITYIDDDYGQRFSASVSDALRANEISQSAAIPYSPNNQSIANAASQIAASGASVVVVIGDATSGPVMLDAIDNASRAARPVYIVNDAMRRPTTSAQPFGGTLASRVTGVSPVAFSSDRQFVAQLGGGADNSSPFAGNAYDCVNLITLAALAANSTDPDAIASLIPTISDSGTPCSTFVGCRTGIEAGSNVNYDGESGQVAMSNDGDLAGATFELFGFDETGRDVPIPGGFVTVRA
ncbi:MAG TPA: ABC transporter substrate-binding protein [Ilumatobacteraceae bacterium]|jgi:branched-chain amino acid transport system substrate-binding protein